VTLAIQLALLGAACSILHGTISLRTRLATMQSGCGDSEHSGLNTATASGRTRRVFAPLAFTINNASCGVALALLLVAIAVWA